MTTVIAAIEAKNEAAIVAFLVIFAGAAAAMVVLAGAGYAARFKRVDENMRLLTRQMRELQRKLDALLKHQGIEMPPPPAAGMSPKVEQLAKNPKTKLAAIKLYQEENPGIGLREAKELIEAIYQIKK